jgi:hypothetical protein
LQRFNEEDVDGRDKPGHDEFNDEGLGMEGRAGP